MLLWLNVIYSEHFFVTVVDYFASCVLQFCSTETDANYKLRFQITQMNISSSKFFTMKDILLYNRFLCVFSEFKVSKLFSFLRFL